MSKKGKIIGVGGYSPKQLTNEDFVAVFGKPAKIVDRKLPHNKRYSLIDLSTGKIEMSNTDMAYKASMAAIDMAGIMANDIDMIIYSTLTPDFPVPPCYTILQEILGIKECMGFDIRSGCAGFGTAMVVAQQCIATGLAARILVVGADLFSSRHSIFFEEGIENYPIKALYNLMFFGDAAGAIILESTENENEGIFSSIMGSTKPDVPFGSILEIGGSRNPYPTTQVPKENWPLSQNGILTEKYLPKVLIESVEKFLIVNNMKITDFMHFVFPVASKSMGKILFDHFTDLDIEKVVTIGEDGGALANAAIPLSFEKGVKENRFKKGDKILVYAGENTRWQHAVTGLYWGI
ncbi:hypothetical protein BIU88_05655 [Chlorobaculum limnaeum]|uniref:3-oxoacyl-ACP synthase n=1 Tax=Chlorobaculum limnaeum TaxID=274537 RepID=A0A1D8D693_CHLLM|nr:3-oxoacyl-ACP synthase III family protein [Chlorobaculum limnaeum]AOS83678.1 hypothetical protein BIU88_05655 [Chlorobaculum limnaeum]